MLILLSVILVLTLIIMMVLLIEGFIVMVSRNKIRQGLKYFAGALTCGALAAVAGLSILSMMPPPV